jgi:hypothetical protein
VDRPDPLRDRGHQAHRGRRVRRVVGEAVLQARRVERHHEVRDFRTPARVEDGDDVRVVDRPRRPDLGVEPDEAGGRQPVGAGDLQGVGQLVLVVSAPDAAHAAPAEVFDEPVARDVGRGRQGLGRRRGVPEGGVEVGRPAGEAVGDAGLEGRDQGGVFTADGLGRGQAAAGEEVEPAAEQAVGRLGGSQGGHEAEPEGGDPTQSNLPTRSRFRQ